MTRYRTPLRLGFLLVALALVGALAAACSESNGGDSADNGNDSASDLPVLYEGYESEQYAGTTNWICHPDNDDDLCKQNLDATVVTAEGVGEVEEFVAADDPPIDCFYVYPTTSDDEGVSSDLDWAEDEEGYAVLNQAARLGEVCRVFAPAYRSVTSAGLAAAFSGESVGDAVEAREIAYGDVLDAWKQYMANENDGRGVVLVSHSQGSSMLGLLIAEEIDTDPDARDRLVGAYLAGWPNPALVGGPGTFENVGLCEATDDVGCVTTWATFADDDPSVVGGFFAQTAAGDVAGACVNPAAPGGGPVPVTSYLPGVAAAAFGVEVDTDHIITDVVVVECVDAEGAHYLAATMNEAQPLAAFVGTREGWGLHTIDISLVQGNMIDTIAAQRDAWVAAHS